MPLFLALSTDKNPRFSSEKGWEQISLSYSWPREQLLVFLVHCAVRWSLRDDSWSRFLLIGSLSYLILIKLFHLPYRDSSQCYVVLCRFSLWIKSSVSNMKHVCRCVLSPITYLLFRWLFTHTHLNGGFTWTLLFFASICAPVGEVSSFCCFVSFCFCLTVLTKVTSDSWSSCLASRLSGPQLCMHTLLLCYFLGF